MSIQYPLHTVWKVFNMCLYNTLQCARYYFVEDTHPNKSSYHRDHVIITCKSGRIHTYAIRPWQQSCLFGSKYNLWVDFIPTCVQQIKENCDLGTYWSQNETSHLSINFFKDNFDKFLAWHCEVFLPFSNPTEIIPATTKLEHSIVILKFNMTFISLQTAWTRDVS